MVSPSQSNVGMHLTSPVWRWATEQGGSGELATRKTRSGRPEVAGVLPPSAPGILLLRESPSSSRKGGRMLDLELVLAGNEFIGARGWGKGEGGDLELTSSWKGDTEGEIMLTGAWGCGIRGGPQTHHRSLGEERKERKSSSPATLCGGKSVGTREKEERKRGGRRR
uniref:DUF834 domain-containing protein n=1 Tax=Oryza rufipogon TaxID=4529 RepID=A0A0E0P7P6_ORYRU